MIPLLPFIAKVFQKLINMYYFPSPHHLLFIPSEAGSLMGPNFSIDSDLLKAPGVMSLRPFLSPLLGAPAILNTLTRSILKLPIAGLCGSPDSFTRGCPTLVPHPLPCLCLHTWPLLFFSTPALTDFPASVPLCGCLPNSLFELPGGHFYTDNLLSSQTQMARV